MTMTSAQPPSTTNDEVARYLADVAAHLGRLDPAERTELLDDLEQHLVEVAAEPGPPLHERLGPPAAYAADLLGSVGVDPEPVPPPPFTQAAFAAVRRLAASEGAATTRRFVRDLHPAWLLARGILLGVLVLVSVVHTENNFIMLVCMAGGVAVSLAVARRHSDAWRRLGLVFSVVIALLSLPVMSDALDAIGRSNNVVSYEPVQQYTAYNQCLTNRNGQVIENLYPYDKDGRPLDGVLLYDQTGQPVNNLCPAQQNAKGQPITTTYARDANGNMVVNVFPRSQTLLDPIAGTTTPVPPPAIVIPKLAPATATATTTTTTTAPTAMTTTTTVP